MAELNMHISIRPELQVYAPGTNITGHVNITSPDGPWECDSMEVVLFWRTSGIGTRDEGIAYTEALCEKDAKIPSHFSREFQLTVPLHPYTYNGKLIKIGWYLGLYVKKGWLSKQEVEIPVLISPQERIPTLDGAINGPGEEAEIFYDEDGRPVLKK